MYLTAIIDWHSRKIVGWRLSDTLSTQPVLEAVRKAVDAYIRLYNSERPHSSLDNATPDKVFYACFASASQEGKSAA